MAYVETEDVYKRAWCDLERHLIDTPNITRTTSAIQREMNATFRDAFDAVERAKEEKV